MLSLQSIYQNVYDGVVYIVKKLTVNEYSGRILVKSVIISMLVSLTVLYLSTIQSTYEMDIVLVNMETIYKNKITKELNTINAIVNEINSGATIDLEKHFQELDGANYIVITSDDGRVIDSEPKSKYMQKKYKTVVDKTGVTLSFLPYNPKEPSIELSLLCNNGQRVLAGYQKKFFLQFEFNRATFDTRSILFVISSNDDIITSNNSITLNDFLFMTKGTHGFKVPLPFLSDYKFGILSNGINTFKVAKFLSPTGASTCYIISLTNISTSLIAVLYGIFSTTLWCYIVFNTDLNVRKKSIISRSNKLIAGGSDAKSRDV